MHHPVLLALAIPLFTSFILLEMWIARKKRLPYFNLPQTIANVSIGIAERACDVLTTLLFFGWFQYLQQQFGFFHIKPGIVHWILLLLFTDFIWYWYHRLAHEINICWAAHIVHHQSEDFNYTVSARITIFQAVIRNGFWSILPIIGYPAEMISSLLLVHGLYPFFIHTRLIGKLGVLEYVLVTPSHHRVHHACDVQYLDKNYGDVFIIWDKLFGTFQKEEQAPTYGITHPLKSHSFLWQHFHYFIELMVAAREKKGFVNRLKVFFARPDLLLPEAREKAAQLFGIKHQPHTSNPSLNRYVIWQIIAALLLLVTMTCLESWLNGVDKFFLLAVLLLTLINGGAILEKKTWIGYLEAMRLLLLLTWTYQLFPYWFMGLAITTTATLLYYYRRPAKYYYLLLVYKKFRPFSF